MKKKHIFLFLIAIISAAAFSIHAQQNDGHIARNGDILHPGLAYSPYLIISINDSTKTVTIDPDVVTFDSSLDAATYIDSDTISYVQFATKHRFLLQGDTLSYIGFENRATYFRLDSAVNAANFPLKDGGTVRDKWSGSLLQYGSMILKRTVGISSSRAEEGWKLTDGTDTLRNTVRLKWTLDMAYADPDSVNASMPDSITSDIISDMQVDVKAMLSERLLTERTIWFSEDARYPVLTDSRVSRIVLSERGESADTIPLSMLAIYYPPSFQYSDTGEDYVAEKPHAKDTDNTYGEYGQGDNDHGTSLKVGNPELSGNTIAFILSSPSGTRIATVTLFTDSGIRLTEPKEVAVGPVAQRYSLDVSAEWKGVLLMRVEAGEESYTRKVIL
ncbi:MAG: hypothetical protein K2L45_12865 [Muribaculaceae bacterium]|nr:hypothetical protein [Muribaculaceae bacterium]